MKQTDPSHAHSANSKKSPTTSTVHQANGTNYPTSFATSWIKRLPVPPRSSPPLRQFPILGERAGSSKKQRTLGWDLADRQKKTDANFCNSGPRWQTYDESPPL